MTKQLESNQTNTYIDNDLTTYYVQIPAVEFLPGQRFINPSVSREFYDRDLAKISLEHVRKTFPDATIGKYTSFDCKPDEVKNHYRMLRFDKKTIQAHQAKNIDNPSKSKKSAKV